MVKLGFELISCKNCGVLIADLQSPEDRLASTYCEECLDAYLHNDFNDCCEE